MKILVTGGNGFIGSNLIKKLLSEGHNVVSLDDLSTGLKEYEVEGCNYVYGDIENLLYWKGDNFDLVYHANEIYEEYNQMAMPPYNWLEDSELESIVTYLEDYTKVKEEKKAELQASQPIVTTTNVVQSSTPTYIWILVIVCVVLVALSLYVILLAMKTIAQHAARYQSINKHLMNRLGLDTKELEKEFDEYLEGEVNKKVEDKIKVIKKEINEKLNKFK